MKKKGFSLIELLAVIVIIGILALIAVQMSFNYLKKSRDAKRITATYNMGRVLLATRTKEPVYGFDQIGDGNANTTLDDLKNIFTTEDIPIYTTGNKNQYWYFSNQNAYLIAICSEENEGKLISNRSPYTSEVECTADTYFKIPTAVTGGIFDRGVNFQITP